MRRALPAAISGLLLLNLGGCLDPSAGQERLAEQALGTGVVSTVHPLVSQAGAEMLRRGGNAVDAAAAVQWALNVVEPSMSGLGGGSLILLWLNDSRSFVYLDGREMAPAAATPDQFLLPGGQPQPFAYASTRGYAVGVPGTLRVFSQAVEKYGRLALDDSFGPAIGIAENGFIVDEYLARYIAASEQKLKSWPASARTFFPGAVCPPDPASAVGNQAGCVGGTALRAGDRFIQMDLAQTFRLVQDQGVDVWYTGEVAKAIVGAQSQRQGRMTLQDLEGYAVKERGMVETDYRGFRVVSASLPSAGGLTMLQMLEILEGYELASATQNSADYLHLLIETMHLAYQDRYAYQGDSDFVRVPVRGLLHPEYIRERRALIDPATANPEPRPGNPWKYEDETRGDGQQGEAIERGDHTTHFVVVDGGGNIAAVTTTLESLFGTGIMVPGYGFLLNNQMTDFDFKPGGPNQVEPKKRPRSSMTPTIVLRAGRPTLVLGSPGGPTITTTVLQVLLNVVEFGQSAPDAVKTPRIFSSDFPGVAWEPGISSEARQGLSAKGHSPSVTSARIGNVQAAQWLEGAGWVGVADNRAGQGAVVYVAPGEVGSGT